MHEILEKASSGRAGSAGEMSGEKNSVLNKERGERRDGRAALIE